jgi:hypothetical protein
MSLLTILERAARGEFPSDNGSVEVLPSPVGACDVVVALTAHSFVAADVSEAWVDERFPRDDFTGPLRADFVAALAGKLGVKPGSIDVLLFAAGSSAKGPVELLEVGEGDSRTDRARQYRDEVRSYTDQRRSGIINLGKGVDRRWELSIELESSQRTQGAGRTLIEAARALVPENEFLFASVAPGNARCLRATLAAGFRPLGAEVLFLTRPERILR